MGFLQILQLVLAMAPAGIQLTSSIVTLIQQIESTVAQLPSQHQQTVANLVATALVAGSPANPPVFSGIGGLQGIAAKFPG